MVMMCMLDINLIILARLCSTHKAAFLPQEVTEIPILLITVNDPSGYSETTLLIGYFSDILILTDISHFPCPKMRR